MALKKAVKKAAKKRVAKKKAKPDPQAALREVINNGFTEIERLLEGPHDDSEVEDLVSDVHKRIQEEMGDA